MDPIVAAIIAELTRQNDNLKKTFAGAAQDALDWRPGPDTNSLGVLAMHVAGSEKYWIGDVITGRPSTRDRDAEFRTQGLPEGALTDALDAALADSIATLEPLRADDLNATRYVARFERDQSIITTLLFALNHVALHVGHAEITRQLYDQQHA